LGLVFNRGGRGLRIGDAGQNFFVCLSANAARSEGATAEKAVPFLCAARRSFVVS
jgi:hypothetical protein